MSAAAPESHRPRAIDRQTLDPDSVLACTRRFLAWRRGQPALRQGDLRFLDLPEPLLGFVRGQAVLALFNLGPEPRAVPIHDMKSSIGLNPAACSPSSRRKAKVVAVAPARSARSARTSCAPRSPASGTS